MTTTNMHRIAVDRRSMLALALMAGLSICMLVSCGKSGTAVATAKDAREAILIVNELRSKFQIHADPQLDSEPAVFCNPGRRYSELLVYNIANETTQDKMLDFLRALVSTNNLKRVVVEFRGNRRELLSLETTFRSEVINPK